MIEMGREGRWNIGGVKKGKKIIYRDNILRRQKREKIRKLKKRKELPSSDSKALSTIRPTPVSAKRQENTLRSNSSLARKCT